MRPPGALAPRSRIQVGQIGCGRIAREHDMPGVLGSGLADIAAVCDVDSRRLADGKALVETSCAAAGRPRRPVAAFGNYKELLADAGIDAVVISTPDHSHAEIALAAIRAGKDVYLQKPMTMTIAEGIRLRDEIAKTDRIFQIGSQQRSAAQFRRACEFVRSGRVGRLRRIEIGLPVDPTAPDSPEEPVPANLDYDAWLGPAPFAYYTEQRVHPRNDYGRPGWLRNEAFCLGMITGWGSHHFDIAHWAMDAELTGPSRVEGMAEFPKNSIWNVHGPYRVELTYPGGIQVSVSHKFPNGLKFIGDEGWIFVTREGQATASDPVRSDANLKALDASDPRLLDPAGVGVQLARSTDHHLNWLESVVSRAAPITPASTAHRSTTACLVSWIAMKLGRPLTWDAVAERFVGDDEANSMISRPERRPYGIGRLPFAT